jgi:hypothetical protein
MISVDHASFVISIPKADTIFVETNALTGYEVRSYDEYALMRELAGYLDSEAGATLPVAFSHNTSVTISGVVYARALLILAPYTVVFEAGTYQVKLVGGTNNNLLDVLNPNGVSVIPANSAGLQTVNTAGGSGATAAEVWSYGTRSLTTAFPDVPTAEENAAAAWAHTPRALTAAIPTAEENAAATIAALIEGGLTVRDVLRLVLAVTAGDATGLEGATMKFKSLDGTKDRVEATYAAGDRTVTALDAS